MHENSTLWQLLLWQQQHFLTCSSSTFSCSCIIHPSSIILSAATRHCTCFLHTALLFVFQAAFRFSSLCLMCLIPFHLSCPSLSACVSLSLCACHPSPSPCIVSICNPLPMSLQPIISISLSSAHIYILYMNNIFYDIFSTISFIHMMVILRLHGRTTLTLLFVRRYFIYNIYLFHYIYAICARLFANE